MKRTLFFLLCLLMLTACETVENKVDVKTYSNLNLRVYTPQFSAIGLRCQTMPGKEEESVIYVAEAAFTEARLDTFFHANIDGNHVSDGVWYEGAPCVETPQKVGNTGGFVWYNGAYQFFADTASAEQALRLAAENGGMGFRQETIIHKGKYVRNTRTENPRYNRVEIYRVLAELDGRLCIIENIDPVPFSEFLPALQALQITEALYMDMGNGWNYSWYRLADGSVREIHPVHYKCRYCTNWIVFYM